MRLPCKNQDVSPSSPDSQVQKTPGRGAMMRNKSPFLQDGDWYLKPRFWAMKNASRPCTSTWHETLRFTRLGLM